VIVRKLPTLSLAAAAALVALGSAWLCGGGGSATAAASRTPRSGVVIVNSNLAFEGGTAAGTGIVLTSSGEVLTNNHVIRGAHPISVRVSDGHTYSAHVLGYSVSSDIALLKLVGAHGLMTAQMGNSDRVNIGAAVTAVGNAGGSGTLTVTTGKITDLGQAIEVSDGQGDVTRLLGLIQTSARLVPGDSGGPLLFGGRVIGVDAAGPGGGVSRDGYAIPINPALEIAKQIESGHRSPAVHIGPTAFLGVALENGTGGSGVVVHDVVSGSAAQRAGIESGDLLIAIGPNHVTTRTQVQTAMLSVVPGRPLRIAWIDGFSRSRSATVRPASGPPQ
jgi:S1-C subfamily serine protease